MNHSPNGTAHRQVVGVSEATKQLAEHEHEDREWQQAGVRETRQVAALHVLHHEEEPIFGIAVEVDHRHHVGMDQLARDLSFLDEH
jgi:hypothetical protein